MANQFTEQQLVLKTWADVRDAFAKYSGHLPGTAKEAEAEFTLWKMHWEGITGHMQSSALPDTAVAAMNACVKDCLLYTSPSPRD